MMEPGDSLAIQDKVFICPYCGARLSYILEVHGKASMDSNGTINEHGHITEKVRCNVCMPGEYVLPTKLVETMIKKCRNKVLFETANWRTL
jgi:hypothetical protein